MISFSRQTESQKEQLEKKVDKHNRFAERVPIMEEQIKVINHRISDLEHLEHLAGGEPR